MIETEITFQGLNFTPYGDISPDGQLESCVGMEMHNGSLRPSVLDGTRYSIPEEFAGVILNYIHSTPEYSHFIFLSSDSKSVYWAEKREGALSLSLLMESEETVSDIKAIANTLIVFSESGMTYHLFKDEVYKTIGNKPPETVIQFTLVSELYRTEYDEYYIDHDSIVERAEDRYTSLTPMELKEEYVNTFTFKENSLVSSLVSDAMNAGRIVYPVFARYAYRLFDSSYIMHSSPVLLVPNTDVAPVVIYRAGEGIAISHAQAIANASLISYEVVSSELEDWKDIIQSVDIFISSQIYSRTTDAKITHVTRFLHSEAAQSKNYGIFSMNPNHYAPKTLYESWAEVGDIKDDEDGNLYMFYGEKMKDTDFLKKISETSVFYLSRSIQIKDMKTNESTYLFDEDDIKGITLENLVFQETLPDDWQSHDTLIPENSFVYNRRLSIFDYKRIIFGGYDTSSMMAIVQEENSEKRYYNIYTHIQKGEKNIVVKNTCSGIQGFHPMFLFYPDTDAYKMTIINRENDHGRPDISCYGWEVDLYPHSLLNGAYWFGSFRSMDGSVKVLYPPATTSSEVSHNNSIATSEVNNPFLFPLKGRNTVGTGQIIALASIATPLSTGQFGAFDLMIFTEEGNYASTINDEGLFSTIKPMQRDVCINPKHIVTADYTLVYISERGVMSADGNNITCISESIDGTPDSFFGNEDIAPRSFFPSSLIAYDYAGNRLIFGSRTSEYAYIRNKDGLWSTAKWGPFASVLNVYPYSFIQQERNIIRLDKNYQLDPSSTHEGFLCTRPLKFGSLRKKKIHRLSVEGSLLLFRELQVWVSNDGENWYMLGSSGSREIVRMTGHSYKYWRIAISVKFKGRQNISGFRILLEESMDRRFR